MNGTRSANVRTKLSHFGLILVIAVSFLAGTTVSAALSQTKSISSVVLSPGAVLNLTGAWTADDGGTYYIRQIGNTVWWAGLSGDSGRSFTDVFQGSMEGSLIVGNWADVPQGQILQGGSLTLSVNSTPQGVELRKRSETGGFGHFSPVLLSILDVCLSYPGSVLGKASTAAPALLETADSTLAFSRIR